MLILRLLLLALLLTPAWGSMDRRQELAQLRQRIEQLKKEIEQAAEDRSEAADALKQSERRISDVNRNLRELDRRLATLSRELAELDGQARATREELEAQERQLATLLRASHPHAGNDALRLLAGGQNPAQVARQLVYLRYIGQARQRLMRFHAATLARLETLEAHLQQQRQRVGEAQAEQKRQRQQLEQERRARQQVLAQLSEKIRQQRREVDTLVRDEQRLARLIERLSRMSARPARAAKGARPPGQQVTEVADASLAGLAFDSLKGRLALPVRGEILARYGQPREGGGPTWKGLFIRAPQGREVRSVGSGRVVFADWLRGFGNLIIIDHGKGYLSLYSNNESLYKQAGELVRAGDVIATVGNTGGQEEPGLYFELRHEGRPFDPLTWLKPGVVG